MNQSRNLFLGLDIGGTKSAAVLGYDDGQIIDRVQFASNAQRGPQPIIDELCEASTKLVASHGAIAGVGVSIGGPLDAEKGVIYEPPNLPGWTALPLKEILEKRLGQAVRVEHDAAACALAEYRWGTGRGATRLIYLTCGTGFGAGLVFDGKIYRGANGRSVEVGHARLREDGPIAFNKRGGVEAFCAASALGRIAAWRFPDLWPAEVSSTEIVQRATAGVAEAIEVVRFNAHAVGDVCATLGDLLRPDVILLGSSARYFGPKWITDVRDRFAAEVLPETAAQCRIDAAGLGDRLQDCSALAVAVDARQQLKRFTVVERCTPSPRQATTPASD